MHANETKPIASYTNKKTEKDTRGYGSLAWSYSGKKAPLFWRYLFDACGGKRQSPVNIETSDIRTDTRLGDLMFNSYESSNDSSQELWTLKNNGNSVTLTLPPSITIQNGGLPGLYQAHHLHFHWGSKNSQGSEHELNGKRYPMELHIVHYNSKYDNISQALVKPDGLAVLGVLFKIGKYDNPKITHLIKKFIDITHKDLSTKLEPFPLRQLLPKNLSVFYRYEGSLTTPPCSESVTWSVFKNHVYLSLRQMMMFRNFLLFSDSNAQEMNEMVNNFRPIKPLNGRVIVQNRDVFIDQSEEMPTEIVNKTKNKQPIDPKWALLIIPVVLVIVLAIYINHKRLRRAIRKKLPNTTQSIAVCQSQQSFERNRSDVVYIEHPVTLEGYNEQRSPKAQKPEYVAYNGQLTRY